MLRNQINDLFQASLMLGLAALFGAALLADLHTTAPKQADSQIAQASSTTRG